MRTLWKCCIRALKENRSRTIVTIIGVAMATVLITTLACIGTSFLTTVIQFLKATEGTAHEHYLGVKQENLKYFLNNQSIEELWLKKTNAYYHIDFQDDQRNQFVLGISNATDGWFAAHGQKLVEGRMPERDGEIVLEKNVRTHLGYDLQVGDKIDAYSESGDKTFELVGFFEDEHLGFHFVDEYYLYHMEYYVEGNPREHYQVYFTIDAYTYGDVDTTEAGEYHVSLRYTKAALYHRDEIAAALMGISNELYEKAYKNPYVHTIRFSKEEEKQLRSRVITFEPNSALEAFEGLSPFHLTQATVWVIAFSEVIFLFFVLAGVFCINNSFDVSITERVRFYGMISSIGSSKRQRRMLVWMEAFVIGLYGIPLGLMLGIGLSFGLVQLANLSLKLLMPSLRFAFTFRVAWWAILIAVLQAIFMIALSAMEAAMRAAKITPMEAIRSNDTVRSKGKKKRTPWLIKKLFGVGGGIAWQNYKRAKVKYRATIISISVSVAFLLAMLFVPFFFRFLERELQGQYGGVDCQVEIIVNHESGYDQLSEIRRFPEVTKGQIIRDSVIVYKEREQLEDGTYTAQPAFFIHAIDDETFDWL
ncbi:MAG: FtsX-like permease family protein, partial [Lachnospiraceae bacterium]|nr:FtsX-like permease family protein [Lachnospiraceae bacterium]